MDQDAIWYGGRPRPRRLCVKLQTAKNSTPNAPKLTTPPHRPPPSAPKAPLAPRSYGARPRRLLHLSCPPDLLTLPTPFPHTFRRLCPQRKFQGAKVPGNKTARERMGQGTKWPGNERAREQKRQGAIWTGTESARVLLANSLRGGNWPGSEKVRATSRFFQVSTPANNCCH